ncbi:MAG: bifunctional methylenetetrahydrofolate dehydrogenase/methenyltetrahydrofolate cyclohydrolase [Simkaniaceae bacterium]
MTIIDGKAIAEEILLNIQKEVSENNYQPGLAFILVGDNPASQAYVRMKKKTCQELGFHSKDEILPDSITEQELLDIINTYNRDSSIDGILVQQPLPEHISTDKIIEAVVPEKDVDGFHPINIGYTLLGSDLGFRSCTPLGIHMLLQKMNIDPRSKHVVVVGRSNIVGKPIAAILMQKKPFCNATVTVVHSMSKDLLSLTKKADILIAAIGRPRFVTKDMVKEGAIVIDVGINRIEEDGKRKIVGDVAFDEVAPLCSYITPVPKGVGPMTIAMLMHNTFESYKRRRS